jgi:hypothetical protein
MLLPMLHGSVFPSVLSVNWLNLWDAPALHRRSARDHNYYPENTPNSLRFKAQAGLWHTLRATSVGAGTSVGVAVAKRARELTSAAVVALERVRMAVRTLADVEESLSFGNPTFRVGGRAFAVVDRYRGRDCLWLRVAAADREDLLKCRGWFPSTYDPHQTALCCALEHFDWRRLGPLVRASYNLALPQ